MFDTELKYGHRWPEYEINARETKDDGLQSKCSDEFDYKGLGEQSIAMCIEWRGKVWKNNIRAPALKRQKYIKKAVEEIYLKDVKNWNGDWQKSTGNL